ncbi:MAG: DNA-formamidopyrimidine glycosylase family protein [Candidatus Thorarchaeota archaeon]
MSIELPEASILAEQMQRELVGKTVISWSLNELEKLQKSKMVSRPLENFDKLVGRTIRYVVSRGNGIRVILDDGMNLFIAPEYGGSLRYIKDDSELPKKIHLKITFADTSLLTVRLKGWGNIDAASDTELEDNYVYRRDFSDVVSPDETRFTLEWFSGQMSENSKNIKMALVGKEAILVGLQNSAFQDLIYQAGIHPKKKASELTVDQIEGLYKAIISWVRDRKQFGGKDQFSDLYGVQGTYTPSMCPNMKDSTCPKCGSSIEKLAHGGGHVYLCPKCQK